MDHNLDAKELLVATRSVTITFDDLPAAPVVVADPAAVAPREAAQILDRYLRHGFAMARLPEAATGREALTALADCLGLGESYLPPLYMLNGNDAPRIAQISAAHNAGTHDADHPSFGRADGQRLHCDGTLQDIGFIKSTILLCEAPAAEGGDTILFNSCAAFRDLARVDLPAAAALTAPGTLVRQANINGCTDANAGPVFAIQDGSIIGRYSVTETDSWAEPAGVPPENLRRGIAFLAAASRPTSHYFHQLRMGRGEAILFDNTRISHGRLSYVDSPTHRRCMYRSLHLRHPQVRHSATGAGNGGRRSAG